MSGTTRRFFRNNCAASVDCRLYGSQTKGRADFALVFVDENPLLALARQLGGRGDADVQRRTATLERIEPYALGFPILLNDEPAELHVIHARGLFGDAADRFLRAGRSGESAGAARCRSFDRPNRPIAFPTTGAAPIEEQLKKESRVELHGIYFAFGKATIRPESEPVLRDIASALTRIRSGTSASTDTPTTSAVTPSISISQAGARMPSRSARRALSVSASRLTTAGFGASHPNTSNDTLSGRARNRRVELVRQ